MPLHIPITIDVAAMVWAYPARVVTGGAPTEAAIWAYTTRKLAPDLLPQEVEISQAPTTENAVVSINVITANQSLGSKDIIVDVPAGAIITKVTAVARISIMNDSATAQKIDLKLEVEGVALFNQVDVVGFPAVDGASSSYTIAEDATGEVTADGQVVTLEAKTTLSSANAVRFQAEYFLFITYRMG